MKYLKIFRGLFAIGIIMSIFSICTETIQSMPVALGGVLALEIWFFVKIQREINRIKSGKQVIKILDKILDDMKEEGVDDLKNLKKDK